jgi:hypothetical protein
MAVAAKADKVACAATPFTISKSLQVASLRIDRGGHRHRTGQQQIPHRRA